MPAMLDSPAKRTVMPESLAEMATTPHSGLVMTTTPEPRHTTAVIQVSSKNTFLRRGYCTQALVDANKTDWQCDGPTFNVSASGWRPSGLYAPKPHSFDTLGPNRPPSVYCAACDGGRHYVCLLSPVHESVP